MAESKAVGMRALEDDLGLARKSLLAVEESLHELDASPAASGYVSVAAMAADPSAAEPYRVQRLIGILLGILAAAGLAILAMLLADRLDDRIGSPEDLRLARGTELLGCVSQWGGGARGGAGKPVFFYAQETATFAAEDVRDLMVGVLYPADGRPAQTLLVTSAARGDGKTSLALNLAASIAALGKRVLVVDGDLRKPDLAATLGIASIPGLSDLMARAAEIQAACRGTGVPGLRVLLAGSPRPGAPAMLGTEGMRDALVALRAGYDHVLLDGPPLTAPETRVLAAMADGVILACMAGSSRRKAVRAGIHALRRLGARLLGVALIGVPPD